MAADSPGISVIVPVLNAVRFLERTISSIQAQDYSPLEFVVVDNGSTDGSQDLLDLLGVRWEEELTPGAGAARARGVSLARFDYLLFLDADDVLLPGSLSRLMAASISSQADFVYGGTLNVIDSSYPGDQAAVSNSARPVVAPLTSSTLTTRATLERFGPLQPDNVSWPRLVMTARRRGASFQAIPEAVTHRTVHDRNISHLPETRSALVQILRELPASEAR